MKASTFGVLGVALACAALSGCDSEGNGGGSGDGGQGASGDGGSATTATSASGGNGGNGSGGSGGNGSGGSGGQTTSSTPAGPGATLAVRKLLMGDTTPGGLPSGTAWKGYGLNLDQKVSTAASTDLCQPIAGATISNVYPDGDAGIDNSFGKNVIPILSALAMDFSTQVNSSIAKGEFSILLRIDAIGPDQTGMFPARVFMAGFPPNQTPQWNGMDAWPIRSDSLHNGDLATPKGSFPTSAVIAGADGRVWTSNGASELELRLSGSTVPLVFPIRAARMSATLSGDNQQAVNGVIGGVIDTEDFIAKLAKAFGAFDPTLCPPSATFESIAQQFRQASDILADGTQDPTKPCNGISIGLGFTAEAAQLGPVVEVPVPPDPCN